MKAELLYQYIMCDDAATKISSAQMNRVLTAQRQLNISHGEDVTLESSAFSICSDSQTAFLFYLLVIFSGFHVFLLCLFGLDAISVSHLTV